MVAEVMTLICGIEGLCKHYIWDDPGAPMGQQATWRGMGGEDPCEPPLPLSCHAELELFPLLL